MQAKLLNVVPRQTILFFSGLRFVGCPAMLLEALHPEQDMLKKEHTL